MQVYFSRIAEQTLVNIYHYIAVENHAPENAEQFIKGLRQSTVNLLSHSSKIGRLYRDNVRFIIYKNYTITYAIDGDAVIIADVYAPGKNWR